MKKLSIRLVEVAIVLFVLAILLAEGLIYAPGVKPVATLRASLNVNGSEVTVSDNIQSSYEMNLSQTLYLVAPAHGIRHLYYYYDPAYPSSWSSPANWFGLSQHLQSVADQRNLGSTVTVIDAAQLAQLVSTPPISSTALVIASGVLPSTVFTKTLNSVTPWIQAGGLMLWVGDTIGYYSGVANQPIVFPSPANPGNNGTAQFLNMSLLGGAASSFGNASVVSTGFGLNYPYALQRDGVNLTRLTVGDGVALGPTALGYTNIASLNLGLGRIIYFASPVLNDPQLSIVIWNLFESLVSIGDFQYASSFDIAVAAGVRKTVTFQYPLPVNLLGPSALVCSFAFDNALLGVYANETCIPIGSGF